MLDTLMAVAMVYSRAVAKGRLMAALSVDLTVAWTEMMKAASKVQQMAD